MSDGSVSSAPATVSITVTPVNDAPTASPQTVTTPEDTARPITLSGSDVDGDPWKRLHETLRSVENEEGVHLGRALAGPVAARFEELTAGRYRALRLDASLQAEGLLTADANDDDNVLSALSVGTRDQLSALIRLTIADQLRSAVVLDDHLVHSDLALPALVPRRSCRRPPSTRR